MTPVTPAVSAAGVLLLVPIPVSRRRRLLHCKSTGDKTAGVTGLSGAVRYRRRAGPRLGEFCFHQVPLAGHAEFPEESQGSR